MSQATLRRTTFHIGLLQIAIIILAVATALIHLQRGLSMGSMGAPGGHAGGFSGGHPPAGFHPPAGGMPIGISMLSHLPVSLSVLFILNFVGYIVLVAALYLPALRQFQRIIRWVLIVYTAVTIIMYFLVTNGAPNVDGYVDKVIEVALIVLLLIEDWQVNRLNRAAIE